jgi:hypothetical protein
VTSIDVADAILVANVHPALRLTIDDCAHAADQIDTDMRVAVPEVADVSLDVTAYSLALLPLDRDRGIGEDCRTLLSSSLISSQRPSGARYAALAAPGRALGYGKPIGGRSGSGACVEPAS